MKNKKYKIPKKWKRLIDKNFMQQMLHELHMISGINIDTPFYDSILHIESTYAWVAAFGITCIETENYDLFKYYDSLPWYDSDLFDDEIGDLFIKYGLIIDKTMENLISKHTSYKEKNIYQCEGCGHYFPKEFMIVKNINNDLSPEDNVFDNESLTDIDVNVYICKYCNNKKDNDKSSDLNEYYQACWNKIKEVFSNN